MLPAALPIFPLPNVVLFPNVCLPLHIFEPRYREMVADALRSDRMVGMVLLRPGWERDYHGRPPVYSIGCAGLITHVEPLSDGRYNIMLRGLEKFRIRSESAERAYRMAAVDTVMEPLRDEDRDTVRRQRQRLETLLGPWLAARRSECRLPANVPDADLIHGLAQYLELDPLEKQALLEREGLVARCQSLIELLEMKVLVSRHPGGSSGVH